jgi:hypothetical protein
MSDIKKEKKRLYLDAMYFHLINKGHSEYKAEFLVRRIVKNKRNII